MQFLDLTAMSANDVDFTSEFHLDPLPPGTCIKEQRHENGSPTDPPAPSDRTEGTNDDRMQVQSCHGVAVWFDVGFSDRFCKESPVLLSTSPDSPSTHWAQTLLTFRQPVAITCGSGASAASSSMLKGLDYNDQLKSGGPTPEPSELIGTDAQPALALSGRISIARSTRHRSIDISLELAATGRNGRTRRWPAQLFEM